MLKQSLSILDFQFND